MDREVAHSKIADLEKAIAQLKEKLEKEVSTYNEEYEDTQKQLVEHQESLSAIEFLYKKLTKEVQLGREKCQGLEQDLQAKSSQVKQYAKEVERLKQQVIALAIIKSV